MKNKKSIMAFSALQILVFHMWVNITGSPVEMFLRQTAYIGVDIFFFVSGYSLSKREIGNYWVFVGHRFKMVYIKYAVFAVAAAVYMGWKPVRLLKVVTSVELFTKGGGAFLWFLPAIMIFYILFPLFLKCYDRKPLITIMCLLVIWLIIGTTVTSFTSYREMFIFYNRIPVFIVGFLMARYGHEFSSAAKLLLGIMLTAVGAYIMYGCAFRYKLQVPVREAFYVCVIPAVLGIVALVSFIPETRVIKWIGASTLEMYAIQMIFGFNIAGKILKMTGNSIITNILVLIIITAIAVALRMLEDLVKRVYERRRKTAD